MDSLEERHVCIFLLKSDGIAHRYGPRCPRARWHRLPHNGMPIRWRRQASGCCVASSQSPPVKRRNKLYCTSKKQANHFQYCKCQARHSIVFSTSIYQHVSTWQTAVCKMASKPPSGASRLPDMRSRWSFCLKELVSLVRVMTLRNENGGSLLVHGSANL